MERSLEIAGTEGDYQLRANNAVANLGLIVKLEPLSGKRINPYIAGEAGTNVFYSEARFNRKNRN